LEFAAEKEGHSPVAITFADEKQQQTNADYWNEYGSEEAAKPWAVQGFPSFRMREGIV
jgi:hypothetical protein